MSIFALRRRPCAECGHVYRTHGLGGRCGASLNCLCYAYRCDSGGRWLLTRERGLASAPSMADTKHQITGNDLDVSCECGWYNHNTDRLTDRSATAHILRHVAHQPVRADEYEAAYRALFL